MYIHADNYKSENNVIISTLLTQAAAEIRQCREITKDSKKDKNCNIPVRFILDEFPAIGHIPSIIDDMTLCKKYNMSYMIVVQVIPQVQLLYRDKWDQLIDSFDTIVYTGNNSYETRKWIKNKIKVPFLVKMQKKNISILNNYIDANEVLNEKMFDKYILCFKELAPIVVDKPSYM